MVNYVKFLRGTPEAFARLTEKDNNTLYFISETNATIGSLYLGAKLISGQTDISQSSLNDFKDVVIDSDTLVDGSVLMFDYATQTWINKTLEQVVVEEMTGATATAAGTSGLVPVPDKGENLLFLRGDATWADPTADLQAIVATLVGSDSGKSIKEIAVGALEEQLIPENAKESLDTLQEIAGWIQSHPGDAATMNADIEKLKTSVSNLEDIVTKETTGLSAVVATLQEEVETPSTGLIDKVASIENILYDTTDDEGNAVKGLVSVVNSIVDPESGSTNYLLTATYNAQVGDIDDLVFSQEENTTIIDEINSINQRLTWVDMTE